MTAPTDLPHEPAPDYETLAKTMLQQWQESWKGVLQNGAPAAPEAPKPEATSDAREAPEVQAMLQSWQSLMQPAMAATQQFWQQVLQPAAATSSDKGKADVPADVAMAATDAAKPAVPPLAPAAAATPMAGADGHAELARRIDLLSARLLRCEVELDKLRRADTVIASAPAQPID